MSNQNKFIDQALDYINDHLRDSKIPEALHHELLVQIIEKLQHDQKEVMFKFNHSKEEEFLREAYRLEINMIVLRGYLKQKYESGIPNIKP